MTTNPATGIACGYISAQALDDDLVQELQNGTDVYYEEGLAEAKREWARSQQVIEAMPEWCREKGVDYDSLSEDDQYRNRLQYVRDEWDGSEAEQNFNDAYQPDEPIHEGVKDGVSYCTSWLGGALNVWIFQSPVVTHKARRASPCVPNAGILDTLDGDVTAYDVPADWRREQAEYCNVYHCPGDCGRRH